jgi:tRNA wybutosine-synthesizing protein 3
MKFDEQKKKQLSKSDKSNEGSWDVKINGLCDKINKLDNFYTTSSCAGRVVLLKGEIDKQPDAFLFKSHKKISLGELKKALDGLDYNGLVEFKQSSCILHVACSSVEKADELVRKAKEAGWKYSGIMSLKRNIVELHSTEHIDFPIFLDDKILVNDDFLKVVVVEANKRLERVWGKIDRLKKLV